MSTAPSETPDTNYADFPRCGDLGAEVSYLVIVVTLSVIGNIFMIGISLKDTNLRGGMLPLICLAIGEVVYVLITSITAFCVMGDMNVVHNIRRLNICPVLGTVNLVLVQFDLTTHGLLGLIRYLAICHPLKYRKYITLKNSIMITVFNGLYAIILGYVPSIIVYDNEYMLSYTLDPSALNCMMKLGRMASSYICIFYFGPPMVLAGFSYILCFYKLRNPGLSMNVVTKNQKRLAVTLATSFFIVFVHSCFYPMSIILFEGKEHLCHLTRRHFTWLILHNSLVNPVAFLSMYAYKRKYFRKGVASSTMNDCKTIQNLH